MSKVTKFERQIGITFKDRNLLQAMLTHKSALNDADSIDLYGFAQSELAFLGDALIKAYCNLYLASTFNLDKHKNGKITSSLVSNFMMYLVLEELSLSKYLEYEYEGIKDDNPKRFHAHGTFLEALIYAIYHERGNNAAKKFCFEVYLPTACSIFYSGEYFAKKLGFLGAPNPPKSTQPKTEEEKLRQLIETTLAGKLVIFPKSERSANEVRRGWYTTYCEFTITYHGKSQKLDTSGTAKTQKESKQLAIANSFRAIYKRYPHLNK